MQLWAFGVSPYGLSLQPDNLWGLTHVEYMALRHVYDEAHGGHGAKTPDQSSTLGWPTQTVAEKKAMLGGQFALINAAIRERKNARKTACAPRERKPPDPDAARRQRFPVTTRGENGR